MIKKVASDDVWLEKLHKLSFKLISIAEKGRFISDYFRDISQSILDFSDGDYLSIVASDTRSFYRYTLTHPDHELQVSRLRGKALNNSGNSEHDPLEKQIMENLNSNDLEQLVLKGIPKETPNRTAGGGLWIEQVQNRAKFYGCSALMILPIRAQKKAVGTVTIGWKDNLQMGASIIAHYQYLFDLVGFARSHRRARFLLGERIKELKTIYQISRLGSELGKSLDEIMAGAADIIPLGFMHPELTCCRIVYSNQNFKSRNFSKPVFTLKADIEVSGQLKGFVEVGYIKESTMMDKEPFLKEEQPMLIAIAGELGHISERKNFEEERERLQQQLLHADRLVTVGQLTAGIAHELNEPLGGILGFAQLIKKYEDINENVEKDIDKIIKAALHGREIIKKLLLFSRQTPPEKVMVNINEKIEDGLYLLESRINKSSVKLIKEFAADLPLIRIDPAQLNQVLVNLVVNAIQAMPEGGSLTIRTESAINAINIIVQDTGIGMTEEQLDKIFIPFYTTKGSSEGVGLGLPVALGIIQSHRGSVDVKSQPGKGTKFTVRLPIGGDGEDG